MKGNELKLMETKKQCIGMKCIEMKKKRNEANEHEGNEGKSSQPTPIHNPYNYNPIYNQSQLKTPYNIN